MSEETRRDIEEMVDILKNLDREDLLLVKGGAKMLEARQNIEKQQTDSNRAV